MSMPSTCISCSWTGDLSTPFHLRKLGDAALRLLMELKHNGAIEAMQVALAALAVR